jgi:predicted ArsR family transcriptional regulator
MMKVHQLTQEVSESNASSALLFDHTKEAFDQLNSNFASLSKKVALTSSSQIDSDGLNKFLDETKKSLIELVNSAQMDSSSRINALTDSLNVNLSTNELAGSMVDKK